MRDTECKTKRKIFEHDSQIPRRYAIHHPHTFRVKIVNDGNKTTVYMIE